MSTRSLPRAAPESQDVDPVSIARFLDAVRSQELGLHSFMLLRHGHVLAEGWWSPYAQDQPHLLYSLSKSFTSSAAGFAVQEGLFSLDDRLIDLFPDEASSNPSEGFKKLKVRHTLSMATGHVTDTQPVMVAGKSKTWVHAFFETPIEKEPGTHFLYNSGASYMISALIQKKSGQRLLDYLKPRLFDPLGITPLKWEQSPDGIDQGGSGLYITTEDIAKFGMLYLRKGVTEEGQRLLSKAWIDEATRSHVSNGDDPNSEWAQGYGFQFWRCRHNAYRGDGAFGQYCIVVPDHDIVIAMTSGSARMPGIMNAVWDNLLPGFSGVECDDKSVAEESERLKWLLSTLEIEGPKPGPQPDPSLLEKRSGTYSIVKTDDIPYDLEYVKLEFSPSNRASITLRNDKTTNTFRISDDGWSPAELSVYGFHGEKPALSRGAWTSENRYHVVICCVQTPYILNIAVEFEDAETSLDITQNVSFGNSHWKLEIVRARPVGQAG